LPRLRRLPVVRKAYRFRVTSARLLRGLVVACHDANRFQTFSRRQSTRNAAPSVKGARRAGFQTFSAKRDAEPAWVALPAVLQEFLEPWDVNI